MILKGKERVRLFVFFFDLCKASRALLFRPALIFFTACQKHRRKASSVYKAHVFPIFSR